MTCRRIRFYGNVQCVGFRYTTYRVAKQFDVTGYVRNCSDGSVELVVEGTTSEIKRFLNLLREKMSGHIDGEEIAESSSTGEFFDFCIDLDVNIEPVPTNGGTVFVALEVGSWSNVSAHTNIR